MAITSKQRFFLTCYGIQLTTPGARGSAVPQIKEATVKRFHYEDHEHLRRHLSDFIKAYNFGRRLKTPKGLTPYEFICKPWTSEPQRFNINPIHQMPGLGI